MNKSVLIQIQQLRLIAQGAASTLDANGRGASTLTLKSSPAACEEPDAGKYPRFRSRPSASRTDPELNCG